MNSNNQYGYNVGISTIEAIIKIAQYIENTDKDAKIVLVAISEAFGAINRTLLWATLYKKGLTEEMIRHVRSGHHGTRLTPKYKGEYGSPKENNIGVFQGSALRAILFIIYMGDLRGDLAALNI